MIKIELGWSEPLRSYGLPAGSSATATRRVGSTCDHWSPLTHRASPRSLAHGSSLVSLALSLWSPMPYGETVHSASILSV
jgi:hypothetical protein